MNKVQTIFWFLLLLVIIFSMDQAFGNPIVETFKGIEEPVKKSDCNNCNKDKNKLLTDEKSDDQPLYFGFSL